MKKSTLFRILLPVIMMIAGTTVKAQGISALGGLNAATKAVYCLTDQVKLNDQTSGSATYTWVRYSGIGATGTATPITASTGGAMVDATITAPGYYSYVATGTNANGCPSDPSDPITVYVLPNISVAINGSPTACVSTATSDILTATASNAGTPTLPEVFAYTYQWYKGSTAISGATGQTYTLNNTTDAAVGAESFYVKAFYVIKPTCTEGTATPYTVTIQANPVKPVLTITP